MFDDEQEAPPQPWEKQDWETAAAFKAFTEYWLLQPAPRSAKVAYSNYRAAAGHKPNKTVPSSFRRWMRGVDNNDRKIAGAMTWKERAEAYDKWLQDRITEARIKRGARINIQWEDTVVALFAKFEQMVKAYDPEDEGADLMTLVTAMEKLYKILAPMFGFQQPIPFEVGRPGDMTKQRAKTGTMTTADRLKTIAEIFQQATDRAGAPLTADSLLAAGSDQAAETMEGLKGIFESYSDDGEED